MSKRKSRLLEDYGGLLLCAGLLSLALYVNRARAAAENAVPPR